MLKRNLLLYCLTTVFLFGEPISGDSISKIAKQKAIEECLRLKESISSLDNYKISDHGGKVLLRIAMSSRGDDERIQACLDILMSCNNAESLLEVIWWNTQSSKIRMFVLSLLSFSKPADIASGVFNEFEKKSLGFKCQESILRISEIKIVSSHSKLLAACYLDNLGNALSESLRFNFQFKRKNGLYYKSIDDLAPEQRKRIIATHSLDSSLTKDMND